MEIHEDYLQNQYNQSELVIGLVCAVGTKKESTINSIKDRLKKHGYTDIQHIKISKDIINKLIHIDKSQFDDEFIRISSLIDKGNLARSSSKDSSILALKVVAEIITSRETKYLPSPKRAYIIDSLKRPEEVNILRDVYSSGFYLFGLYSSKKERISYLVKKNIEKQKAKKLIKIDEDEASNTFGQRTSKVFQLSDFFIDVSSDSEKTIHQIYRVIDLLFSHPFITPTFDEFAMFMAYSSSLRSADLSRQVGAVITKRKQIISSGANDCPQAGGGLYWPNEPYYNNNNEIVCDEQNGRDYQRGWDSNNVEKSEIIKNVLDNLKIENNADNFKKVKDSKLGDITEYGRVVHAEMEALLGCARNGIKCSGGTLYCTTFPCHNCAKHIIAAGIKEVIYIEPYPKSKAFTLFNDSITQDPIQDDKKVVFKSFVGVGPNRFFDLFSMKLGRGKDLIRKEKSSGKKAEWQPRLRVQMLPCHYIEREMIIAKRLEKAIDSINEKEKK